MAVADRASSRPVLAADTVVVLDRQILGKPADDEDAKRMLRLLSHRTHEVLTAVILIAGHDPGGDFRERTWKSRPGSSTYSAVEVTAVEFVRLSRAEIDWYVRSEERRVGNECVSRG